MKFLKYIFSPMLIITIGFVVSIIFNQFFGPMSWVPIVFIYWGLILIVVNRDSKKHEKSIFDYFKIKKYKWYLFLIAIIIGLLPLPIFLLSYQFLATPFLLLSWIVVAIVNPFFEELFWRGYMLEKGEGIPPVIKSIVSSLLFTLSHIAIWGVFSKAMLTKELVISVFIMGMVWSFLYLKSKSLVLPYFSHLLVDVFNCSVLAFMNLLPMIH